MKRYIVSCGVLLIMLPLLYVCTKEKPQSAVAKGHAQQEILIGLIPVQNVLHQRERYPVLKQYLAERLSVTVTITSLSGYGNIVERFSSEKLDGALVGSFTYVHQQPGVELSSSSARGVSSRLRMEIPPRCII